MIGRAVGNYVVLEKMGAGGMGTVYVAEHPRIKRRVAIKVLRAEMADDAEAVARFFTEARSANEIHNEHIIEILDFGEFEDGAPYLIMEWLDGRALTQYLAQRPRPALDRILHILGGIADALSAAHARGIVHRDLKPDNIFLVTKGPDHHFVKVLDFGVAKLLDQRSSTFKTKANSIVGTPAYMSPEQCQGANESVDGRSDIYALGVIAYQMVTGRIPFHSHSPITMLAAHATEPPPAPRSIDPAIPEAIEAALLKALAKSPDARFQQVSEFVAAMSAGAGVKLVTSSYVATRPSLEMPSVGDAPGGAPVWGAVTLLPSQDTPLPSAAKGDTVPTPRTDTLGNVAAEAVAQTGRTRRRGLWYGGSAVLVAGAVGAFVVAGVVRHREPEPTAPSRAAASAGEAAAPAQAIAPAAPIAAPAVVAAAVPGAAPAPGAAPGAAPAPAAAPAPGVAPAPAAQPGAASRVTVSIRTDPPGAEIHLDDAALPNPFSGVFERSDVRHRVVVKMRGYRPWSTWEVFSEDRLLDVHLKPASGGLSSTPSESARTTPAAAPARPVAASPAKPAAPAPSSEPVRVRPMHTDDTITPDWDKEPAKK